MPSHPDLSVASWHSLYLESTSSEYVTPGSSSREGEEGAEGPGRDGGCRQFWFSSVSCTGICRAEPSLALMKPWHCAPPCPAAPGGDDREAEVRPGAQEGGGMSVRGESGSQEMVAMQQAGAADRTEKEAHIPPSFPTGTFSLYCCSQMLRSHSARESVI